METLEPGIEISIIIPLLNEAGNIQELYQKLTPVIKGMHPEYEIIFIDDGSKDKSFEIIKSITANDYRVKGISLSRNFGHQIAITAGIGHASGNVLITMDADMQHPPEIIPQLYAKYKEGFDIVNTIRTKTDDSSRFKELTSKYFYKLINNLADIHIEPASADFRLMSRKATDAFLKIKEKDRFIRGLVSWMGFRQAVVEYTAPPRFSGKSKYSIGKMFRFAADGITSFSSKPLRLSLYMGFLVSMLGLVYAVYALIENLLGKTTPGWTSILISILILGGIQLISIGIIGEYLAHVFNESKNRPLYFVQEYTSSMKDNSLEK